MKSELSFFNNKFLVFSKMEKNRGVIRELLKFEYELGDSAKEAVKNINSAKGNGTVSYTNAKVWFAKFRNNEMDIADKKGHRRNAPKSYRILRF